MSFNSPILLSESDSDSEDLNLPSRDECETRCQKFAEITGTDTALAMFYLQDREWNLEKSVSDYFADNDEQNQRTELGTLPSSAAFLSVTASASKETALAESKLINKPYLTVNPPLVQPRREKHIRVLSWNIDGLDPDNIQSRTEGMCSILLQEAPEIIFLQEVVDKSLKIIQAKCNNYNVFPGLEGPTLISGYFTAMLLRKDCVSVKTVDVTDFPTTLMHRNLLQVKCEVKDVAMTLLTSHLESTVDGHSERKKQLTMCFERMMTTSKDQTVIFGGDLNLREKELKGLSAKPLEVHDIWEYTGKRKEAQFTWDLTINDNKQMSGKFQPRCRFDRLYIRNSQIVKVKPVYFELVGIQRLASCRRFPSDHWGILAHLDILNR